MRLPCEQISMNSAVMKRQRTTKRFQSFPWIIGGIILGATVNHVAEVPLKRQLELEMSDRVASIPSQNDFHIVFSTGCSQSQNWQSYVFFYHAMRVKQPGEITRIVSGCSDAQRLDLARRHQEEVFDRMSNKFHIHFTPGYENLDKEAPYKYFNKPFGLRHWMENFLGFPENRHRHNATVVASLDPDMILVKPLLNNFSALPINTWNTNLQPVRKDQFVVTHGHPIAQEYSYESTWRLGLGDNVKPILGEESPSFNVSNSDARLYFPAGPPYILTAWDMYDIVLTWTAIAPNVHKNYPRILGEMFAYSIAAAHHGLKHQLNIGLMVSDTRITREGWHFLNNVPPVDICSRQNANRLPHVLHYCQDYSIGDFHVSKYDIPNNFVSCEAPLLVEPPQDAAVKFNFSRTYHGDIRVETSSDQSLRRAFMSCSVIAYLNDAATFFKKSQCALNGNFNKTWSKFPIGSV